MRGCLATVWVVLQLISTARGQLQEAGRVFAGRRALSQVSVHAVNQTAHARRQLQTSTIHYQNPLLYGNFPDPGIMKVGTRYYAFATNGGGGNVQAAASRDLIHWTKRKDALPTLPTWASKGKTWAPEAIPAPDGGYLLYFAAAAKYVGCQCIGVAHSMFPSGPYRSASSSPLICPSDQGGAIDPSPYVTHTGDRYLLWKNDGNSIGKPTYIYLQRLSADGMSLAASAVPLIRNTEYWEGAVAEAPFLHFHLDRFYLYYSANDYYNSLYAIGYATSAHLEGPYKKPGHPWQDTSNTGNGNVIAPGAPNIVKGHDGNDWLTYHSTDPNIGGLSRMLCAAPVSYVHSNPKATLSWQVPKVAQ